MWGKAGIVGESVNAMKRTGMGVGQVFLRAERLYTYKYERCVRLIEMRASLIWEFGANRQVSNRQNSSHRIGSLAARTFRVFEAIKMESVVFTSVTSHLSFLEIPADLEVRLSSLPS